MISGFSSPSQLLRISFSSQRRCTEAHLSIIFSSCKLDHERKDQPLNPSTAKALNDRALDLLRTIGVSKAAATRPSSFEPNPQAVPHGAHSHLSRQLRRGMAVEEQLPADTSPPRRRQAPSPALDDSPAQEPLPRMKRPEELRELVSGLRATSGRPLLSPHLRRRSISSIYTAKSIPPDRDLRAAMSASPASL